MILPPPFFPEPSFCHGMSLIVALRHDVSAYENFVGLTIFEIAGSPSVVILTIQPATECKFELCLLFSKLTSPKSGDVKYKRVSVAAVPASSSCKSFFPSPGTSPRGDGKPATLVLRFVCCAYPRR